MLAIIAVSCGYDTCFVVWACDGLYQLTKSMDRIETPSGFQSIVWNFVRHTVSRCLIFPTLPKVTRLPPVSTFGSIWVVLWLFLFRSGPPTFPH